jgi:O-antigen/teichoic acid export membrane protein
VWGLRLRSRRRLLDLTSLLILLLVPLALFAPVTVGSKTLVPADNLYQWEPFRTYADQVGVPLPPHNELLSDLILENYAWKRFILQSIQERDIPLWNPSIFAGVPFLAAGQHSALYPPSLIYYVLPLERAYGVFTVFQLWLAGASMYALVRALGLRRFPALTAGLIYQLSGFFIVSVNFQMMIAAAAWLPLVLAIIEVMVRKQEEKGAGPFVPIVYVAMGAAAIGLHTLAGHVEIIYYTLLVSAIYAACRLAVLAWRIRAWRPVARVAAWLLAMVLLGLGLGTVQLLPLYELVSQSFREGSAAYADVVGWAYPKRQAITFLVPDFFGNPAHHGYWDIVTRRWVPVDRIFWMAGNKNYVEAGSWVGVMALLLAGVGVAGLLKPVSGSGRRAHGLIFGLLAVLALLFAFGTPLYALLYYGLPGYKQLHSAFRWVFPYTLSLAVLAALGAQHLTALRGELGRSGRLSAYRPWVSILTWGAMGGGLALVAGLLAVLLFPGPFVSLADQALSRLESAQATFSSGQMLLSYQWRNLLIVAVALAGGGIVLRVSRCRLSWRGIPVWQPLALGVIVFELFVLGAGFNPAADPAWLRFTPPSIEFLKQDTTPWRLTTYQVEGATKTLNANAAWLYDLQDVRGYDSIIPRRYVEVMRQIEGQGELLYNRIAPIYEQAHLRSPLLDLLNVKYVMTEGTIELPDYRLVYDGEVRIYENLDVLPRAFALTTADPVDPGELGARLGSLDPRQLVLLDADQVEAEGIDERWLLQPSNAPLTPAAVTWYTPNEVFVDVVMPEAGWLVLADSYFPGWKAFDRACPPDAGGCNSADQPEIEVPLIQADGTFRAVPLAPGAHTVRFKYTPLSFKLGLFGSFMAGIVIVLLALVWLWGRFYRESSTDVQVRRVAVNSSVLVAMQLFNKLIDMAFTMLMLRILTPEQAGRYWFAVAFVVYFEIITRFGLGILMTREVSKAHDQANRYLWNTILTRLGLWLGVVPLAGTVLLLYALFGGLTADTAAAIGLFAVGVILSNVADSLSSVFMAYERMEYPAALSTATTIVKVSLGTLALLLGWGFVGLAGMSIAGNLFTVVVFVYLVVRLFFRPRLVFDGRFSLRMLRTSAPLMANSLLSKMFIDVDVLLLKPIQGDEVVGYYGAPYRYLNGLNIIPAYFTQAIFPAMSRYATSARDSLLRAYLLSLRLLLILALPIAVVFTLAARELIILLGTQQYLPHAQIALMILIWFLPLSYVNSVTHYVLIALDEQRFLTKAFLLGVSFNVIANLIFIPIFSYKAAAVITILSEVVLLTPFYLRLRQHLGTVPWLTLTWRPVVAAVVMAAVMWALRSLTVFVSVPVGGVVYLVALLVLRTFTQEDMVLLLRLVPERWRDGWLSKVPLRPAR